MRREWARRLMTSNRRLAIGIAATAIVVAVSAASLLSSDADGTGGAGIATETGAGSFPIMLYQGAGALGGTTIDFSSLLGDDKPVVLNFWAAQCPPCVLEMPWLEAAHQRYGDRVLLIGVDVGPFIGLGSNEQAQALLADLGITYTAGAALDDRPLREYQVIGMPTTVFFDRDGGQVRAHSGLLNENQIDEAFSELANGVAR